MKKKISSKKIEIVGSQPKKIKLWPKIAWNAHNTAGPLLLVLDEAPLQHKMLNFGLFQAKTYANGLQLIYFDDP